MSKLLTMTAAELHPLFAAKQLSPVELTKTILKRMAASEPTLHAYITTLPEEAIRLAEASERRYMEGRSFGPLDGVPIGVKDNYFTKDILTTCGSSLYRSFRPSFTAPAVERLLNAGTIMLGKLNMQELGGGLTSTNSHYGHARNPWNTRHITGGSSGGSAAALAAGTAVLATGSDTFGSIRIPAALCGVYGIKPTYDKVSTIGMFPLAPSLDHAGPMARSAEDLALMLAVMEGKESDSRIAEAVAVTGKLPAAADAMKSLSPLKGLRIGIPDFFLQDADPEVRAAFQTAVKRFEAMGAHVQEMNIPELALAVYAGLVTLTGEAFTEYYELLRQFSSRLDQEVRILFQSGALQSADALLVAQKARRIVTNALRRALVEYDVLAGPASPITAPAFQQDITRLNLEVNQRCMPYVAPASISGTPCLVLPIGRSVADLPIGMQLIGRHHTDYELLQVGHTFAAYSN